MYGIAKHSGSFDELLIDDRNERPLTIALATIVVVWSMAFALTFASGHLGALSAHSPNGATALMSSMDK
jgi:exosome complex RNA-binding protein Csl4